MRGTSAFPSTIVKERGMSVMGDEASLEAMAQKLVADNPKQAAGYRAGKANLLGFFVGQIMKLTSGSADPAKVNAVLKRVLSGEAPPTPPAGAPPPPAEAPSVDRAAVETLSRPIFTGRSAREAPPTPRSGPRDRDEQSPLAQSVAPPPAPHHEPTTLTSASGVSAVTLPAGAMTETITIDAFSRVDLRVGVVLKAERVPRKDKLLDLSVDLGEDTGPRRIISGLALTFAPADLVGKHVLVVTNLEPRDFGKGLVSRGMILAAGPSESLALATVTKDVPAGTRVK
jgi:methionine--tRNA ligase beta chain